MYNMRRVDVLLLPFHETPSKLKCLGRKNI